MTEYLVKFGACYLWDKIKSLTQHFAAAESVPDLAPKIYVSFLFL